MVQEHLVEEVPRMSQSPKLSSCLLGQVVSVHGPGRDKNLETSQVQGIGPQPQVHGQLIDTQVGAVPHHQTRVYLRVLIQPSVKPGSQGWVQGVLLDNGEETREREFP